MLKTRISHFQKGKLKKKSEEKKRKRIFGLILWCSKQEFQINSPVPEKRKKEKTLNMKSFWYFGWKLQFCVSSWNCFLLSFYCLKRLMMVCDLWVDEWNLCLFSSNCILRPPPNDICTMPPRTALHRTAVKLCEASFTWSDILYVDPVNIHFHHVFCVRFFCHSICAFAIVFSIEIKNIEHWIHEAFC